MRPVERTGHADATLGDVPPCVKLAVAVELNARLHVHDEGVIVVIRARHLCGGQLDVPVGIHEVHHKFLVLCATMETFVKPVYDQHAVDQVLLTEVNLDRLRNGCVTSTLLETPSGVQISFIAGVQHTRRECFIHQILCTMCTIIGTRG